MSGLYKGLSGFSLFLSIPLLIYYLGNENYGVWVLVFSLFQWVLLMDFGIQSSLKTKIPLLQHENKIDLLKVYIKSIYKLSAYISVLIFLCFIIFINSFDIKRHLNINFLSSNFVNNLFIVNIFFFSINFVANIHKSLYIAFLKGKYSEESIVLNQFGILLLTAFACICFPDISVENKLILISFINGIFCFLVNVFYTIRFFRMQNLNLETNEKKPSNFITDILRLGFKFMIIQLCLIFVYSSDNYIISNAFSPSEVVPYEIISKLFQLPVMIIFAMLSPLWSMFAKDYLNNNQKSLLNSFKRFNFIFIGIVISILILSMLTPFIISVWIKNPIEIPEFLISIISIVTCFKIFVSFYVFFLSGVGNLNKYILLLLISVLLKIPLSYLFISLKFGINSVILSTLVLMLFWMILIPYQCYNLVLKIKKNE